MTEVLIHYIVLEEGVALSKKSYAQWRDIQNDFEKYVTSLGPWSVEELLDYLESDFGLENEWPFSRNEISSFVASSDLELVSFS